MATKIKRCLYIGLGGTGMKSLLHTKKMFIDTYGEVPPMIGFLGIDTDGGEYSKKLLSAMGEDVTILKNEQLPGAGCTSYLRASEGTLLLDSREEYLLALFYDAWCRSGAFKRSFRFHRK